MSELEKQQANLIMKMAKQLSELHYMMGRLNGVYLYGTDEQVAQEVESLVERYDYMKGLDE